MQLDKEDIQAIAEQIHQLQKTKKPTGNGSKSTPKPTNSGACAKNEKVTSQKKGVGKLRHLMTLLCKYGVLLVYLGVLVYLLIYLTPYILH